MCDALRRLTAVALAVAGLLALASAPAAADDPVRIRLTQVEAGGFPDVRLVALVTDAQDRPLTDVSVADLYVSEDGRPQAPSVELASEFAPVALALVLDTSGSMAGRALADAKAAMMQLTQALGPRDRAAVLTFNTTVSVPQDLTDDKAALAAAIDAAVAAGNTAIFDAVARAIDVLSAAPPSFRRAVVLLTDGVDNASATGLNVLTERVRAQGYPAYVVGLGANLARPTLQAIADASISGQAFVAPTSEELASIYTGLAQRIKTQYVVAYRSNVRAVDAGAPLTITIQIVRSGVILGSATSTFVVPDGHGIVAPAVPQAVSTPAPILPPTYLLPTDQASGPYSPEVAALLGTASALSLLLWVLVVTSTQSLEAMGRRRVAALFLSVPEVSERVRGRSFSQRVVRPLLARLGKRLARLTAGSIAERTERRLAQAGHPLDLGPAEFLGLQLGGALAGLTLFASAALVRLGLGQPGWIALLGLAGALFGCLIPRVWLDRTVKSRKRRILRAMPSALDMLALSARAGMTFDGAISQVVQRWDNPLSDEFRQVLVEFRMGRDRRDALRAMAERTGVVDMMRFANSIVQADSLGVPISKVLFDQSVEMRMRRRQRAEESARIAPVKMLFPMVGLIFPALFVVILGPAVPRFLQMFATAH